ncbi:MAG: DUF4384 domain-containing protein [Spirochaetales bacterium]|jgi:hypothetical protein|nr:DUF4384 domain-containing protein [Spirochaetales bacterium]
MRKFSLILVILFSLVSCASAPPPVPQAAAASPVPAAVEVSASEAPAGLDAAIARIAEYFAGNIPRDANVAVTGIEADRIALSDYTAQEFHRRLEESRRFTLIDQASHDIVLRELMFQNSGEVSEESRHKIGETLGADVIVYGRVQPYEGEHRLVMYATEVQTGRSLATRTLNKVSLPRQFQGPPSVADKIDRAVVDIGRALYTRTPVIAGGVYVTGTTAQTTLSDFLRPRVIDAMQKRSGLFQVLDEKSGNVSPQDLLAAARTVASGGGIAPVPARLVGEFPPRNEGEDAPVTLSLVAIADGAVLGTASLTLSAKEMADNKLSALPPNTTREKFEAKRKALAEYSGKNNAFVLRVQPDQVSYHEGDFLSFSIYAEEDCYFQILNYDAEDTVSLMFPVNARDWEKNRIKAGETRRIPDTPRYLLGPPYGLEYVIVMVYREQIQVKAERPAPVSPSAILQQLNLKGYVDNQNPDNYGKPVKNVPPAATASFSYTILEKR